MRGYEDPGWSRAINLGIKAIFARGRVMKTRPAIVAARAMVLPGVVNGLLIAWVLVLLGDDGERNLLLTGLMLFVGVLGGVAGVFWARDWKNMPTPAQGGVRSAFVTRLTLMSALANIPLLTGFVAFFLGGGYLIYYLGAAVTLILLFTVVRPSRELAQRVAVTMDPPMSGEDLWALLMEPA